MTMRVSKNRIDMDDKILQKPVLRDYGETVVGGASGTNINSGSNYHLSFDGSGDYVECGAGIDVSNSSFSFAFWAKRAGSGVNDWILSIGSASANNGFHVGFRSTDLFSFAFFSDDLDTTGTYTDTDWHHWAGTYDVSTNERILYLDGTALISDTASADFAGTGTFTIGNTDWMTAGDDFAGEVDDVYFFSRVLTPAEVATLYGGGTVSSTSLEAHWDFDDGTGSSLVDDSGNGNTGTITGGTWVDGTAVPQSYTVDLTEGNVHNLVLNSGASFTFSNPPAAGTSANFTMLLSQDSVGSWRAQWPSAVTWAGGIEPTLTTASSAVDLLFFTTIDGGTTWYGSTVGQNMQ